MLTDAAVAALTAAGNQPFSFFPPVRGFAENRWRFHGATRIEFGATNVASNDLVWFARGSVSYVTVEEAAITVALRKELEYSGSAVWPVRESRNEGEGAAREASQPAAEQREVLPRPDNPPSQPLPTPPSVSAAAARRRRSWSDEPLALVVASVCSAAVAFALALMVARAWLQPAQRADSPPISDSRLFTLTREDNYHDVVRSLGPPESEQALSLSGSDLPQRALLYQSRNYAVVLLGVQGQSHYEQEPRYIGAIRLSDGAILSSVHLAHDSTTDSLLRIAARQLRETK